MKPKQKPFRFFLRREPSYELSMSVRFEVAEGYGALVLQRKDANKDPNPTLVYEEREVSAKELRGGRFIHVLPGSSRRQSYALSRLSEEMLGQLPEEGWTELNALTEYGFRDLVTPENLPASTKAAAVQVSAPVPGTVVAVSATPPAAASARAAVAAQVRAAPAAVAAPPAARVASVPPRPAAPPPPDSENSEATDEAPTAQGPSLKAQSPSGAPSALQRAMAAIRAGRATGGAITGNTEALRNTPRPAPTAKVSSPGMTGKATKPSAAPAAPAPTGASAPVTTAELDHLGHAEAIAMVKDLAARLADLEKKYAEGLARERDLLDMLTRWQQRQIGS